MGLQKIAFNFMVERGGKLAKSLLCTKPQKITNTIGLKYKPLKTDAVNFKTVIKSEITNKSIKSATSNEIIENVTVDGAEAKKTVMKWIEDMISGKSSISPENKIPSLQSNFTSLKGARKYAKERAVCALHSDEPYEHMVIIDKKSHKIFGEYKGDEHQVSAGFDQLHFPKSCSIIHGHPASHKCGDKSLSTPISFDDFGYMFRHCDDIIAFNKNGEFSLLMKTPKFKPIDKKQMALYEAEHVFYMYPEILGTLTDRLPKEFHGITTIKQLAAKIKELKSTGKYSTEKLQSKYKAVVKEFQQEIQKIKSENEFDIGYEQIKGIHRFWQDYADELGVVYKTNYSYL